jgi:outer membrane protein OmpA-like peptidoglycan-associated protein
LFKSGSFELLTAARERLAKVSGIVLAYPSLHLAVEGHTDSVGSDEYNRQLSERGAQALRDYLVQRGISPDTIAASGFGKSEPVASNDTPERSSAKSPRRTRTLGRCNWQLNGY